jgi:hypothetical protein
METALAAEVYPARGQCLAQGQTVNVYRARSRGYTVSKTEGQNLEPKN